MATVVTQLATELQTRINAIDSNTPLDDIIQLSVDATGLELDLTTLESALSARIAAVDSATALRELTRLRAAIPKVAAASGFKVWRPISQVRMAVSVETLASANGFSLAAASGQKIRVVKLVSTKNTAITINMYFDIDGNRYNSMPLNCSGIYAATQNSFPSSSSSYEDTIQVSSAVIGFPNTAHQLWEYLECSTLKISCSSTPSSGLTIVYEIGEYVDA